MKEKEYFCTQGIETELDWLSQVFFPFFQATDFYYNQIENTTFEQFHTYFNYIKDTFYVNCVTILTINNLLIYHLHCFTYTTYNVKV